MLDNLNVTCPFPEGFVFNAETAATYDCPGDCARALTTAFTQCQTSLYNFAGGWTQEGRESLYVLTRASPESACRKTFESLVGTAIQTTMADATCGPKVEACFGDYECRADLREGIRATLYPASQAHFEGSQTMCRKTPMFQELYECIDARDGLRAWRRSPKHCVGR